MLDKNVKNEGWAIVYDVTDATLANVDLDFLFFNVEVLQSYYPRGYKHVFVVNLPIILDATIRVIISISNEEMKRHYKIIGGTEMIEYLKPEHVPDQLRRSSGNMIYNNLLGSLLG